MSRSIFLSNIFLEFPQRIVGEIPALQINGVTQDSRQVLQGNLFVAIEGAVNDGHRYISEAIARGAVCVVGTQDIRGLSIPYIKVENSQSAISWLAAAFYGFPARQLTVIGITGTDGKTTTANLIFHIMKTSGIRAGIISTVNAVIGEKVLDTGFHVTTPDAQDIQNYLAQMVSAGITHVVLEATSHGLAQHRVDACEFDIAVVTNITHEHLDYHGNYAEYRLAKARLFTFLADTIDKPQGNPRLSVLNRDDSSYQFLSSLIKTPIITYGQHPDANYFGSEVKVGTSGLDFKCKSTQSNLTLRSKLVGEYNVANCLAATAVSIEGLGISPNLVIEGMATFRGVPGRMERIEMGQNFSAIVDFAHTPNALKQCLLSARSLLQTQAYSGHLIAVFGSAGERDREKRRIMAEISAQLADFTILTAEDPRHESLTQILSEMAGGMESRGGVEGKNFWRVPDRGEAIRLAMKMAKTGDMVLVCGKGHEQSMCFGDLEYPWDDRVSVRAALADLLGLPEEKMPKLPTQE
jgi:UDP-N-acetylmuramoyl-L-alanyl-D-glutamate--2,6-diaminopimelate ligase